MNLELDHLSYSSISSWLYCGAAWNFKYIQKLPAPTSSDLVFGSAFHSAVESFLTSQVKLVDGLVSHWQTAWKTETTHLVDNIPVAREDINWKDESPESLCNLGVRMFNHGTIQEGLLSIKPAFNTDGNPALETKVELHVPGVPIPIVGYIDIMTSEGPGDFKTSSRAWTQDKAEAELQPLFYAAALNQAGIRVDSFTHYVFVKTKTPQFQKIVTTRKPGEMFFLFKMIKSIWDAIEAGAFPINPTSWLCSPDYCSYWSSCRGKWI